MTSGTLRCANSIASECLQLLPTRLAEIAERIDVFAYPIVSHLPHCDVQREICIDNDATDSVGGLHNWW